MVLVGFHRLLWMLSIWAIQTLVFNQIHLFGCITPIVTVYFLTIFPRNTPRYALLIWAFFMGLLVDLFSGIPGVLSASMTLCAMIQPNLLKFLLSKDSPEEDAPSAHNLGNRKFAQYLIIITCIHHLSFFLLEAFSFLNLPVLITAITGSISLSLIIMGAFEYARKPRKKKK